MCRIVYRQLLCPCKRGDACPQNKVPVLPPLVRHPPSSSRYHHVVHPRSLQEDMCEPCAEAAACTATRGAPQPTCRDRTEEVALPPKVDSKPCPACRVSCGDTRPWASFPSPASRRQQKHAGGSGGSDEAGSSSCVVV